MKLYFASPFFTPEQIEREERLKAHLRSLGFEVWSPKENCNLNPAASQEARTRVFNDNCKNIVNCDAVFAITDGKDMGTIWEAGFAYGTRTPIIYYAETLGNNLFNLMLAESGNIVYTKQEDISADEIMEAIVHSYRKNFEGMIE